MLRFALAVIGVGILLTLAGCGGQTTYTLQPTKTCLLQRGFRTGGKLDFVATTATGGAFLAHLGDNFVTVAFGDNLERRNRPRERMAAVRAPERQARARRRAPPLQQRGDALAQAPVDSDLAL